MASYLPPVNVLANTVGKIALTNNVDFYGRDEIGDNATGQYINTLSGNDQTWLYASNMVVDHGDGDDSAWARFYNYAGNAVTNAAYIGGAGNDDLTLVGSASDFMSGIYKLSAVNDATYGLMYQVTDSNNNAIFIDDTFEQIKLSGSGSSYTLNDFVNSFLNKSPIPAPVPPVCPPPPPPVELTPTYTVPEAPPCPPPVIYDATPEIELPPVCYAPEEPTPNLNDECSLDKTYTPAPSRSGRSGPLRVQNNTLEYDHPQYPIAPSCPPPQRYNQHSLPTYSNPSNAGCNSNYGAFQSFLPLFRSLLSGYSQAPQYGNGYAPIFNFNFNFGNNTNCFTPTRPAHNASFSMTPWY